MRVDELIRYTRAFYPGWSDDYAEELRRAFALDSAAKIKTLSRGPTGASRTADRLGVRPSC